MQTIQKFKTERAFPELATLTNKHDDSLIYIAPDKVSALFRSKAWDDGATDICIVGNSGSFTVKENMREAATEIRRATEYKLNGEIYGRATLGVAKEPPKEILVSHDPGKDGGCTTNLKPASETIEKLGNEIKARLENKRATALTEGLTKGLSLKSLLDIASNFEAIMGEDPKLVKAMELAAHTKEYVGKNITCLPESDVDIISAGILSLAMESPEGMQFILDKLK